MGKRFRQELGDRVTEGVRLLWAVYEREGLSQEAIRNALGVTRGVVGRWMYAERQPDLESVLKLEKLYGIPAVAWTKPPSRKFSLPALTGTDG